MLDNLKEIRKKTQEFSILCVDDEENILYGQKELLKFFFKEVYTASNGEEAFEIYTRNKKDIDIILTDVNMPKMDGMTLLRKIKEVELLEYTVILSAREDIHLYKECIDIGINDFALKPITSEKILNILDKYLNFIEYIQKSKFNCLKQKNGCKIARKNEILFIDSVTELYSKSKLDEYLFSDQEYHLILVNLDNFDLINCKYGYKIGDQVLKQVADNFSVLANGIEQCSVFRVVSDEFVFLLPVGVDKKIEKLCHMILEQFNYTKIKTEIEEFFISCSIGVSSGSSYDILRQAHIAMKESREIGKEKYYFFTNNSELMQKREKNLQWLNKIKDVLKKDAVIPYYQPIISNKEHTVYAYEALARILEINRIIKPHYFLESAKLFNLMPDITMLMVKKIFQYIQNQKKKFFISINITEEDLLNDEFVSYVFKMSEKYKVVNSVIIFEFSELVTISNEKKVFDNLKKLTDKGFKLAIDDFGGSHHNIKNLHSIKIDYLKINSVFIEKLLEDKKARNIVKSIIHLAKNIGAKTIAQSVGSQKILNEVRDLGIHFSQGYFIGKPEEIL